MIQEAKNDLYFINGRALSFTENDLGDPNRIAVSLVSGTRIMVYKKGVIDYAPDLEPEKWTLRGYSTLLVKKDPHSIYARLNRLDRVALLVFSVKDYNLDGSENTIVGTDDEGKEIIEISEPSEEFYYVKIGSVTGTDRNAGDSGIATVPRSITYDSGILNSSQDIGIKLGEWSSLFVPHYDDPKDPAKLTWIEAKAHMGIAGGLTSFIDNGTLNLPSIYDGLLIDNQTIYWEKVTDENGNVTKVLKSKGSGSGEGTIKDVVVNGSGNAITDVTLNADKTGLVFTKGLEFAEKFYLDNNFYNKTYIDRKFVTLDTYQSISGGKNFVGGLYVNGGEIKYNGSYWQLDGDLLVTGGITAFADRYSSTSIMDAIVCDEQTITVEEVSGVKTLKVIGGGSGSVGEFPIATTSVKGIASFDSNSFNVSSGHVTFNGGKVKVVTSTPSSYESNTLYVIVG